MTDRLIELLGKKNVTDSPDELREYSVTGRTPSLVLFPSTGEQVAGILKLARREQKKVLIAGNNSQHNFGSTVENFDWCLSLNRMNHIIEHEAADLTVKVESGVRLPQLQKFLNQKSQFLPLDPIGAENRTLGGIVATNSSGPLRLLYGTCRDLVLGMKVVLPDGTIIRAGGKTVKNVAGYDLSKLFIGSMGTLGAITELTFRLFPIPTESQTLWVEFDQFDQLFEMGQSVGASNLVINRCEYANGIFVEQNLAKLIQPKAPHGLLLNVQGQAEMVTATIQQLQQMASSRGSKNWIIFSKKDETKLWHQMNSLGSVADIVRYGFQCQLSVPKSAWGQIIHHIQKYAAETAIAIALLAHAANGIIHIFWGNGKPEHLKTDQCRSAIKSLRQIAQGYGGSLVVQNMTVTSAVRVMSEPDLIWGKPGSDFALIKKIKAQYDPHSVLAPGRFIGGI